MANYLTPEQYEKFSKEIPAEYKDNSIAEIDAKIKKAEAVADRLSNKQEMETLKPKDQRPKSTQKQLDQAAEFVELLYKVKSVKEYEADPKAAQEKYKADQEKQKAAQRAAQEKQEAAQKAAQDKAEKYEQYVSERPQDILSLSAKEVEDQIKALENDAKTKDATRDAIFDRVEVLSKVKFVREYEADLEAAQEKQEAAQKAAQEKLDAPKREYAEYIKNLQEVPTNIRNLSIEELDARIKETNKTADRLSNVVEMNTLKPQNDKVQFPKDELNRKADLAELYIKAKRIKEYEAKNGIESKPKDIDTQIKDLDKQIKDLDTEVKRLRKDLSLKQNMNNLSEVTDNIKTEIDKTLQEKEKLEKQKTELEKQKNVQAHGEVPKHMSKADFQNKMNVNKASRAEAANDDKSKGDKGKDNPER